MSAEVVKKRGRPKKAICDPVEVEMLDIMKKSTTRAKSTKSTTKAVKPKTTTVSPKIPPLDAPVSKPATSNGPIANAAPKSPPPSIPSFVKTDSKSTPPAPPRTTSVTPESSKILNQLSKLSANNMPAVEDSTKSSKPSPATASSKAPARPAKAPPPPATLPKKPFESTATTASTKFPPPKYSKTPPSTLKLPPKFPIAALNSEIVSNISSRAGARPNTRGSRTLPPSYSPIATKITMAIVAMPIAIVTSWVMYQRFVLGEDRKVLVKPGLTMVETLGGEEAGFDEGSGGSSPSV